MKRDELVRRAEALLTSVDRCGVPSDQQAIVMAELGALGGPDLSRRQKWLRSVEGACIAEAEVYNDFTPQGWRNLEHVDPRSPDLKRLRALRKEVRERWMS